MYELGDGWEIYLKGKPRLSTTEPAVSFGKQSTIAVNALAKEMLGDWVLMYFNRGACQIGLKPVASNTQSALCVRAQPAPSHLWRISVRGFLDAFNLDPAKLVGHYDIRKTDWGFVVQLPANPYRENDERGEDQSGASGK